MVETLSSIAARHETAPEPAWLWDAERRRILWANAAARAMFGADSFFDLPERAFAADAPEARAGEIVGDGMEITLAPKGAPVHAVLRVSDVALPRGLAARLLVVTRTKPSADDPAVARRAALFDFAPVALLLCDIQGAIVEANPAAAMVSRANARFLGDVLGEGEARTLISRTLAARHASTSAVREGRTLRAAALAIADPLDGGAVLLVRIEDVTERRELEAMLQARAAQVAAAAEADERRHEEVPPANGPVVDDRRRMWMALRDAQAAREEADRKSAAKTDFLSKLSHEMRNPLNAIIGFSEIMQRGHFGPLGDRRYEAYAGDIRASADHLLSLVDDLLDLGRIEAGQLKLSFGPVALAPIIEECVRLLRPAAQEYHVGLTADIGDLPMVLGDARSIRQVLINLISNALKFTGSGGAVRVSAAANPQGGVFIAVSDTGVGMSASEIEIALSHFGQVPGEHQKNRKGSGLGLPLAKALTEANNASFEIKSEKHKGTRVQIVFGAGLGVGASGALGAGRNPESLTNGGSERPTASGRANRAGRP